MYRAVVYQICIGMYRAVHSVSPGRVLYIGCLGLISTMGFICFHGLLYGGGGTIRVAKRVATSDRY